MEKIFIISLIFSFVGCGLPRKEIVIKNINYQQIADSTFKILMQVDDNSCEDLLNSSTNKYFRENNLFTAFCPADTMDYLPPNSNKRYPFDILSIEKNDTIIYSFKITETCCHKYYGNYYLNNDNLILSYGYCGGSCDCSCDYYITYRIPKKEYKFKNIIHKQE